MTRKMLQTKAALLPFNIYLKQLYDHKINKKIHITKYTQFKLNYGGLQMEVDTTFIKNEQYTHSKDNA